MQTLFYTFQVTLHCLMASSNHCRVQFDASTAGPYIAGGGGGGGNKIFFFLSNIVFEFAAIFLVAILVRNLKKTD